MGVLRHRPVPFACQGWPVGFGGKWRILEIRRHKSRMRCGKFSPARAKSRDRRRRGAADTVGRREPFGGAADYTVRATVPILDDKATDERLALRCADSSATPVRIALRTPR
jgi:hypothetical protein